MIVNIETCPDPSCLVFQKEDGVNVTQGRGLAGFLGWDERNSWRSVRVVCVCLSVFFGGVDQSEVALETVVTAPNPLYQLPSVLTDTASFFQKCFLSEVLPLGRLYVLKIYTFVHFLFFLLILSTNQTWATLPILFPSLMSFVSLFLNSAVNSKTHPSHISCPDPSRPSTMSLSLSSSATASYRTIPVKWWLATRILHDS